MFYPNLRLIELFFLGIVVINFYRYYSAANIFTFYRKSVPHAHQLNDRRFPSHQKFIGHNDQQQLQYMPKNLSFILTTNKLTWFSIGVRSNIIYNLFIVKRLYKYLIQNASNKFLFINDHMHTFDRRLINQLNQPFIILH